jgi:alpha-methylacyl-CoA racemase
VLAMRAAPDHPHLAWRGTFADVGGVRQPGPAPRFSGTPTSEPGQPPRPGQHQDDVRRDWLGRD